MGGKLELDRNVKLKNKTWIFLADFGEREYPPHQEAAMKAGLEKAVQHKEKLLEYDRNRYPHQWWTVSCSMGDCK